MIVLLNGSPKVQGGNSAALEKLLEPRLNGPCRKMNALKPGEEAFRALCAAEAVVVVFPLYVDALPSHLLRFLMGLEAYARDTKPERLPRLYAAAQCGFYEGGQNCNALDVLKHFCARSGLRWCGGIGLGCGGALEGMMKACMSPLEELLAQLAEAVNGKRNLPENKFAAMSMPRWLYSLAGGAGWVFGARKNGLKRKDLYRQS